MYSSTDSRSDTYIPPEQANEIPPLDDGETEPWWAGHDAKSADPQTRAVAYYRHSAQDRQKNSIQLQAEEVRAFAKKGGLRIIHEFVDRGRSGLTAENRPGFMEMMQWVRERDDFGHVLVLDVSRFGRFQDINQFGQYELECRKAGKRVRYVSLGVNDDDFFGPMIKTVQKITSADESRTRSGKVFKGSVKVVEQGFRPGSAAPYGFSRMVLTEHGSVYEILAAGQKKGIANYRVKLTPSDGPQAEVIQEIFIRFADEGLDERQIAGMLSARGILSPTGLEKWSASTIGKILQDQQYVGSAVYNRISQKLKTPTKRNPIEEWIVTPDAHTALVPRDLFDRAQARFTERQRLRDPGEMLVRLRTLYERYGIVTAALLRHDSTIPNAGVYAGQFGSLPLAFQRLFAETLEQTRHDVRKNINTEVVVSEDYDDFLVLNRKLTVLIQPSVPVPNGYGQYWVFRPDRRPAVDITLGVPLAGVEDGRILGYFPFPRLLLRDAGIRLTNASVGHFALHGHDGLKLLRDILS